MERTRLREILVEIFEETRGEKYAQLDDQTNLREGLGFDSVDLVCMAVEVEDRLGVRLTANDIAPIVSVADLLNLLSARMPAAVAA